MSQSGSESRKITRSATVCFSVVAIVLGLTLIEGLTSCAYGVKKAWERRRPRLAEEAHAQYDPFLGWVHRPSLHVPRLYGVGKDFTTNAQGFRASVEYSQQVPSDRFRIICLGDSFTQGFGVGDFETYPAYLEVMAPGVQAVNMGMGAYGVDQVYLWYKRDGVKLDADVLLFAFIANDFTRMTKRISGSPKPVLALKGDQLVAENTPVPQYTTWSTVRQFFRELTYWVDTLKTIRFAADWLVPLPKEEIKQGGEGEARFPFSAVAEHIFEELKTLSDDRGQVFVMVYLPAPYTLEYEPVPVVGWVKEMAQRHSIPFIDLGTAFKAIPSGDLGTHFLPNQHYTPIGNRLVAEVLIQELEKIVPGFPSQSADD